MAPYLHVKNYGNVSNVWPLTVQPILGCPWGTPLKTREIGAEDKVEKFQLDDDFDYDNCILDLVVLPQLNKKLHRTGAAFDGSEIWWLQEVGEFNPTILYGFIYPRWYRIFSIRWNMAIPEFVGFQLCKTPKFVAGWFRKNSANKSFVPKRFSMTAPQTEWGFCQVLVVAIGSLQRDLWLDLCLRHEDHTFSHHFTGEGILEQRIGFSNHLQVNWTDKTQNKRLLGMKGWNYPLQLVFHICFSFVLEHFERIIKPPHCLEAYWRFGIWYSQLPKIYNKSRMQDSHQQGDDFSDPGPLSSPEYPYDQRPRPQQKKTREESFRKFLWR